MFTGLVQGRGNIQALGNDLYSITVEKQAQKIICQDLEIGDSVAVNGVCLTVEKILPWGFCAIASPETLQRTNLAYSTRKKTAVNLETSLRVGSKIGGHFVSGHVDGVGCLVKSVNRQQSWEMTFSPPQGWENNWRSYIAPYIVSKGSMAVNGVSLTIADCDNNGDWFTVAVIPHTYTETNLSLVRSGDLVNLESDILGKYVDRLISHHWGKKLTQENENIDLDFLSLHGYHLS